MWTFLTAVVVCATILAFIFLLFTFIDKASQFEYADENEDDDDEKPNRVLNFAECEGSHHGPTTLGGVLHQTCLRRTGQGELTMWCHTHEQDWAQCIEKFSR
jgi:hypothetical protein